MSSQNQNLNVRHITTYHTDNPEVQKIMSLPLRGKIKLIENLRERGNHLFYALRNCVTSVKSIKKFNSLEYFRCKYCLQYYRPAYFQRHIAMNHVTRSAFKVGHKVYHQNILVGHRAIDSNPKSVVFPKNSIDFCSLIAQRDPLIWKYGRYYMNHNQKDEFICNQQMRHLARLLIEMQKRNSAVKNLKDALYPKYNVILFDSIKDSINEHAVLYGCIMRCYDLLASSFSNLKKAEIINYKSKFDKNWPFARSYVCKPNVTMLSLAENVKLFKEYLLKETKHAIDLLKKNKTNKSAYQLLLEIVFCTMALFNRLKIGEIATLPYQLFIENSFENIKSEKCNKLTEQVLSRRIKKVTLKKKKLRVLFTSELEQYIRLLLNLRANYVSVPPNDYLFFQLDSETPISAHSVMEKHLNRSEIPNTNVMVSSNLQESIVSLMHILHMSTSDIRRLMSLMGLVPSDDDNYQNDDLLKIANLAKILTKIEQGGDDKFLGKTLNNISVNIDESLLPNIEIKNLRTRLINKLANMKNTNTKKKGSKKNK
ncbi:uncharacterized protein LOC115890414 [Sitophilus oryzae]|uniref:Uncharacterized protein LOC115890414 n=1 Tax=Sitophilus oryzae TaxID=7048 RepID=A0A6J2YT96_SITOR|nr:uncharacterized protein LOC115890414 [Sitophilus oryzae]